MKMSGAHGSDLLELEAQIDDDLSYDVEIKDFLKRIMFYNR